MTDCLYSSHEYVSTLNDLVWNDYKKWCPLYVQYTEEGIV